MALPLLSASRRWDVELLEANEPEDASEAPQPLRAKWRTVCSLTPLPGEGRKPLSNPINPINPISPMGPVNPVNPRNPANRRTQGLAFPGASGRPSSRKAPRKTVRRLATRP